MKAKGVIKAKGASLPLVADKVKDIEFEVTYEVEYSMSEMKECIELIDVLYERMDKLIDICKKMEDMDGLIKVNIDIKE